MKTEENLNLDQNNKNTKNDNWKVGVSMAVGAVIGASGTSALADTLHGDVDVGQNLVAEEVLADVLHLQQGSVVVHHSSYSCQNSGERRSPRCRFWAGFT